MLLGVAQRPRLSDLRAANCQGDELRLARFFLRGRARVALLGVYLADNYRAALGFCDNVARLSRHLEGCVNVVRRARAGSQKGSTQHHRKLYRSHPRVSFADRRLRFRPADRR